MPIAEEILARTIKDSPEIIKGLQDGLYEIFGGVIRVAKGQEGAGKIVAHLKFPAGSDELKESVSSLQKVLTQQAGQIQHIIGGLQSSINVLQGLQTANLALSGLNLAVSAAGFVIVCQKLNAISETLNHHTSMLNQLVNIALKAQQRDEFFDTATFNSLLKRLMQLSAIDDVSSINGLILPIMRQYEFTKLMLSSVVNGQHSIDVVSKLNEVELLQKRHIYLGFALAYAHHNAGESDNAFEVINELEHDLEIFSHNLVKLVSEDAILKSLNQIQFLKVKEIASLKKETVPALEYQKDVLQLVSSRPELKRIFADDCNEILLISA
ncbi:MAG: hypothetical protein NWQ54_04805 [Paraglaciecola sp.]|nr:hypothetical protein [Paraglaciecola sp.]